MRRKIAGAASAAAEPPPDGCYLVEVERGYFTPGKKPSLTLRMRVLEPLQFANRTIAGRLFCTPAAMWKLVWFLGDFKYDPELLESEELDETRLISLRGIVRIARRAFNGRRLTCLEAFAPAESWTASDDLTA
jgi:hypothetical protein